MDIGVRTIFEEPTVEGLGRSIEMILGMVEKDEPLVESEAQEWRLQYWKKQLGGKFPALTLPSDRPRPLVPTYRGGAKSISLSAGLCEPLKALSRREGVTVSMLLLAAFKMLLYRYTEESDIVIGVAIDNGNRIGDEHLTANMLPMRTDLSGNPRFTELLMRVKEVALSAYAHREAPYDRLVEEMGPRRELGQAPAFNIVFGVQNAAEGKMPAPELKIGSGALDQMSAISDLTLWITKGVEDIQAGWNYSADLFEEKTIGRMHGHFETILSSILTRPDARLDELEMLSAAEREQQSTDRAIRKEHNYSRFKNVKPKRVL